MEAYLNLIATAVPQNDVHSKFVAYAPQLLKDDRNRALFKRMAERSQIEHRYSFLKPHPDPKKLDTEDFYLMGNFPDTAIRMRFYQQHAFMLAVGALDKMNLRDKRKDITHIIITTCTGFYAPGLDLQIIEHYASRFISCFSTRLARFLQFVPWTTFVPLSQNANTFRYEEMQNLMVMRKVLINKWEL